MFAEKAEKLIRATASPRCSAAGPPRPARPCCRSSRANNSLLFYPVQYEGLEASPNIFYTGATTNQQILPGAGLPQGAGQVESIFLVGSDYVFPRTANKIIKAYAAANGIEIIGEEYAPLGHTDFATDRQQASRARRRRGVQHPQR